MSEVGGTRETELSPQGNRESLDQDASLGPGVAMAGGSGSASTLERSILRQCLEPGAHEPSLKDILTSPGHVALHDVPVEGPGCC